MVDPRAEYALRKDAHRAAQAALERRESLVANLRLAVFLGAAAIGAAAIWGGLRPTWLAVPGGLFAVLVVVHARIRGRLAEARRAAAHYERGLARVEERWAGTGTDGGRFADPEHPYALDLDLFGEGSLFERLCLARTTPGEATLAAWLTGPAGADEVRARQAAVRELAPRLDLREDLDRLGEAVRAEVDPEGLVAWGLAPRRMPGAAAWAGLALLTLATVAAGVAWPLGAPAWPFVALLLVEWAAGLALGRRVQAVIGAVDRGGRELRVLAGVLGRLEAEPFESPRLKALQAALRPGGVGAARRIGHLVRLVDLLEARQNQFFVPVALVLLWTSHLAFAVERWRRREGPRLAGWLGAVGELEALVSLGAYAYENPADPFPELVDAGPLFEARALGHPLLPKAQMVPNDVAFSGETRLLVVSGSNMSGKSTLLRSVGTAVVLALAGAPVRAEALRLSPLGLGATLRIQDSLREGASRFYAEITRLKQVVDLADAAPPLCFLLDEVLSGTNSHDRRIGAESILRTLLGRGAIGLVTTHDLALAEIAETLAPRAVNVHFEDRIVDGRLVFDYRMRPGTVRGSNAIALMRAVGLDVG